MIVLLINIDIITVYRKFVNQYANKIFKYENEMMLIDGGATILGVCIIGGCALIGGIGGAIAGALAGAVAGPSVPGIGTVVGAVAGGVGGFATGAVAGAGVGVAIASYLGV